MMPELPNEKRERFSAYNQASHNFYSRLPVLRPREIAILGGAFLESGLRHLLDSRFTDKSDKLFESGSLISMESRAKLARALGCFPTQILSELLVLGEIRNFFAHRYGVDDFDHPDIMKMTKKLSLRSTRDAAKYFESVVPELKFADRPLPGSENSFAITDEQGFALLRIDLSMEDASQVYYENSLKITWSTLVLATVYSPR
ncbi:hypothetical protein [Methylorubrum aminovorans]